MDIRLGGRASFVIAALFLTACTRLTGGLTGNGADAGSGSSTPSVVPWAANAADVSRFADEAPFGPDAIIAHDKTPVRKSPGNGEIVATLPSGADVVKLSSHGTDDLVCFDEPTDGGLHLMGWVAQSALEEPAPPTPNPSPGPTPTVDDSDAGPPAPSPPDNPGPPTPGGGHHKHRPHGKPHPQ